MADTALSKLVAAFKAPQHDYDFNTSIFGRLNTDKIAKDLKLEELGAERGSKDKPATKSKTGDAGEAKIKECISAAQSDAYQLAEDQIHSYNQRISNLDFEGHFSELRVAGPHTISDMEVNIAQDLNEMNTRRKELLDIDNEYKVFREENGLQNRTAKVVTPTRKFLGVSVVVLMVLLETWINAIFLAGGSERGLLGGIIEAASFSILNIGFSILVTLYIIKQIARPFFLWKFIGLAGIFIWLSIVLFINLALAHYKEAAIYVFEEFPKDALSSLVNSPFSLSNPQSWILFGLGLLFAVFTLTDILTFSDKFPGYSKLKEKWDEDNDAYKDEFNAALKKLAEIRDEYREDVKKISDHLSARAGELDKILSSRDRLIKLYENHGIHLQTSAEVLFSCYFESNKASRETAVPDRFNQKIVLEKMKLATSGNFQPRESKNITKRIQEAKAFLEEQVNSVVEIVREATKAYNSLDKLDSKQEQKMKVANEKKQTAQ